MADSLKDFEEQLQKEALANEDIVDSNPSNERTDADGTVYEFDSIKQAWFPKIDEDFIARHLMNYGTTSADSNVSQANVSADYWSNPPSDINSEEYRNWYIQYCNYCNYSQGNIDQANDETIQTIPATPGENDEVAHAEYLKRLNEYISGNTNDELEDDLPFNKKDNDKATAGGAKADKKKGKKSKTDPTVVTDPTLKRKAPDPTWFEIDDSKNTNVYVSGFPSDVTEDEFKEFMGKVGLVAFDPVLRKPKLKLYKDDEGNYKGDGRCCYIKPESVDLALQILDGFNVRGNTISVIRAKFELKGQYDPTKKKRKLTNKEKKKFQEKQEKLLGWQFEKIEEGRPRCERVVIMKHAFEPGQFEKDPSLMNEISADLREECKKYGEVRKVVIYDRHPDGIASVTFKQPEEADVCIKAIHGRWFAGQRLEAAHWDGKTKYVINETEQEMEARVNNWHSFIEDGAEQSTSAATTTTSITTTSTITSSSNDSTVGGDTETVVPRDDKNITNGVAEPAMDDAPSIETNMTDVTDSVG